MITRTEKILLFSILALATGLRLYNISGIPFTHDEFSAIFRTQFHSFGELIRRGVLPDFHPAGVQVFLYYYIGLSGIKEWLIKLPFILAGIGSVYLIFSIGKEWFNTRTGLLTSAFMAVTQYFIFYSQIARPYSIGLFFGLLAIKYWGYFVQDRGRLRLSHVLGWIFSVAISAYIHYYLLLTLVLLSIIGLFVIRRRLILLCLLSGVGIILLYTPHFTIFFQQLSKGGVGTWLGKPSPVFIIDFFQYLFEFTPLFAIFTGAMILAGIFTSFRNTKIGPMWWTGIILFASSLATGYIYSVKLNPILQFSGLLFSVPLLLLSLFYFMSLRKWIFYPSLAGILFLGLYGLIYERQHYKIFYESPYKELVEDIKHGLETSVSKPLVLLDGREDIMQYYLDRYHIDTLDVILLEHIDLSQVVQELQAAKTQDLLIGVLHSSAQEIIPAALNFFPYLEQRKSYAEGEFFHLKKEKQKGSSTYIIWQEKLQAESGSQPDFFHRRDTILISTDTASGKRVYSFNAENEYGLGADIPFWEGLIRQHNRFLDVIVNIEGIITAGSDIHICTAVMEGDSIVIWDSSPVVEYATTSGDSAFTAFHTLPLYDIVLRKYKQPWIKIFIWNRNRENFGISEMSLQLRRGNPKMYAVYQDILKD